MYHTHPNPALAWAVTMGTSGGGWLFRHATFRAWLGR